MSLFRYALVIAGGGMFLVAFNIDRLGYGKPGSFGVGQLLLALLALTVILIGLLGKRVFHLHRAVAIILLNTLLLIGFLELGSIIICRLGFFPSSREQKLREYPDLPYYRNKNWSTQYWSEARRAENYRYEPYVTWSHLPFAGETININEEGIRHTPPALCRTNAYKIFTFGGSTMWGWGSPDWETIAAHLQNGLQARLKGPVCVTNFGEDGFVSTQSLILLLKQLQRGNLPDLVIFYDGVNDVYGAYETGQVGVHLSLKKISAKFEERGNPLVKWFKNSRLFSLVERIVLESPPVRAEISQKRELHNENWLDTDRLVDSVTKIYLENYRIVGALAKEYNFRYFFFWQPHLAICGKELTQDEQKMRSELDEALVSLVGVSYDKVSAAVADHENLHYIAQVFDEKDIQIWTDAFGHVTPLGNKLIAQKMIDVITSRNANFSP